MHIESLLQSMHMCIITYYTRITLIANSVKHMISKYAHVHSYISHNTKQSLNRQIIFHIKVQTTNYLSYNNINELYKLANGVSINMTISILPIRQRFRWRRRIRRRLILAVPS